MLLTKVHTYFILITLVFTSCPFSTPRSHSGDHLTFNQPVSLALFDYEGFSDFPCFYLDSLKERWSGYFVECPLFGIFLRTRLGLWVWERKTSEMKHPSHYIPSKVHIIKMITSLMMLTLTSCLSSVCQVSTMKLPLSPHPLHAAEVGRKSLHTAHASGVVSYTHLSEGEVSIVEFFTVDLSVRHNLFMYSTLISLQLHEFLFYTLG